MKVEVVLVSKDREEDDRSLAFCDNHGFIFYREVEEWQEETNSEVYREAMKRYGRCTGKVYEGEGIPVGWVFIKRIKEQDGSYLQEAWIMTA